MFTINHSSNTHYHDGAPESRSANRRYRMPDLHNPLRLHHTETTLLYDSIRSACGLPPLRRTNARNATSRPRSSSHVPKTELLGIDRARIFSGRISCTCGSYFNISRAAACDRFPIRSSTVRTVLVQFLDWLRGNFHKTL